MQSTHKPPSHETNTHTHERSKILISNLAGGSSFVSIIKRKEVEEEEKVAIEAISDSIQQEVRGSEAGTVALGGKETTRVGEYQSAAAR